MTVKRLADVGSLARPGIGFGMRCIATMIKETRPKNGMWSLTPSFTIKQAFPPFFGEKNIRSCALFSSFTGRSSFQHLPPVARLRESMIPPFA